MWFCHIFLFSLWDPKRDPLAEDSGSVGPTTYGASAGGDAPPTRVFGVGTSAAAATVAYGVIVIGAIVPVF